MNSYRHLTNVKFHNKCIYKSNTNRLGVCVGGGGEGGKGGNVLVYLGLKYQYPNY